jgi:hypothetical protein
MAVEGTCKEKKKEKKFFFVRRQERKKPAVHIKEDRHANTLGHTYRNK